MDVHELFYRALQVNNIQNVFFTQELNTCTGFWYQLLIDKLLFASSLALLQDEGG